MRTLLHKLLFAAPMFALVCFGSLATAADVDVRLSSREAYVGMPVQLQISINNATDYEQPTLPEIDGVDIRAAGAPAQSSSITIINGRRSESRSITLRYLLTPRRAGTFEIPPLKLKVDGKTVETRSTRFVATKSETGDLLFVEIEGKKDKVFVGQPLDLTLRIFIKPYRDKDHEITLSEGDMWNMISDQTSWGSFSERLRELAENNQRPGGEEVLRDDDQGDQRAYYMYEIEAKVYPTHAGKIDADDVQIVVNYPIALGRSRDPFESFFQDSPFGGRSPLSRMMNDDFMSSPFGNRLSVTESRPIVAEAKVDATEVLPVPSQGRPADYRGAVGKYQIVTEASPVSVNAGDSITLNIGIMGTGPMELVQAPPLFDLPELSEFKISSDPLAGFVRDETKVFSTTIRPRHEGITEIPPIPFSFFNPETEMFETVHSKAIAITVEKADSLALDAIVGAKTTHQKDNPKSKNRNFSVVAPLEPSFLNINANSVLQSQRPSAYMQWWFLFVVIPPVIWVFTVLVQKRATLISWLPSLRSAQNRCVASIVAAETREEIVVALIRYLRESITGSRSKSTDSAETSSLSSSVGGLRSAGLYALAAEAESLIERLKRVDYTNASRESLEECRAEAVDLIERIAAARPSKQKTAIRRTGDHGKRPEHSRAVQHIAILLALVLSGSCSSARADEPLISLNQQQRETILSEASSVYEKALTLSKTDPVDAKDQFTAAAEKYQLLVDAGIVNSDLYFNLGNAYLQSGEIGRAIVNYERAHALAPNDQQIRVNLDFVRNMVQKPADNSSESLTKGALFPVIARSLRQFNTQLEQWVGHQLILWILVLSSVAFWGILIVRTLGYRLSLWRWGSVPALILLLSLGSVGLSATDRSQAGDAIIVANRVKLYAGDGDQFAEVSSLDSAEGQRVQTLTHRGDWTQIQTVHGHIGWVSDQAIERL